MKAGRGYDIIPPMLIDSHAHLDDSQFQEDGEQVIARAVNTGIRYILNVSVGLLSWRRCVELARRHDFIYIAGGIHPHNCVDDSFKDMKPLLDNPKLVAIGEIGLDYYRDYSPRERQKAVFREQLKEARKRNLPVIIHQRESQQDIKEIIREFLPLSGVMHCFSGDSNWARECLDMGFYISFAGNLTYPRADILRQAAAEIPVEKILIETDCPWLAPQAVRGKRNEPANVRYVAEELARIKGLAVDDIIRITSLNFRSLFRIGRKEPEARIAYPIRDALYLNITNRCTALCAFCVKNFKDYVKGHYLRLDREPSGDEIIAAIGDPGRYREVVFCGYGEPLLRLSTVKEVSRWLKEKGARVRIDTNGHGNLINKRSIAPELSGLVDSISVSMNADTAEKYQKLCHPVYGKKTFAEIRRFIIECKGYIPEVMVSVIQMPGVEVEKCRQIADSLGVRFKVRKYNQVG